jgi:hypothetical protein
MGADTAAQRLTSVLARGVAPSIAGGSSEQNQGLLEQVYS